MLLSGWHQKGTAEPQDVLSAVCPLPHAERLHGSLLRALISLTAPPCRSPRPRPAAALGSSSQTTLARRGDGGPVYLLLRCTFPDLNTETNDADHIQGSHGALGPPEQGRRASVDRFCPKGLESWEHARHHILQTWVSGYFMCPVVQKNFETLTFFF